MSRELLQQALHHLVDLADDLRRIPSDIAQTIAALEQELAKPVLPRAFREILIGDNYILRFYPSDTGWMCGISNEMMDAIEEAAK
jgi:hypothetical protein